VYNNGEGSDWTCGLSIYSMIYLVHSFHGKGASPPNRKVKLLSSPADDWHLAFEDDLNPPSVVLVTHMLAFPNLPSNSLWLPHSCDPWRRQTPTLDLHSSGPALGSRKYKLRRKNPSHPISYPGITMIFSVFTF